jgi:hypothetical protein
MRESSCERRAKPRTHLLPPSRGKRKCAPKALRRRLGRRRREVPEETQRQERNVAAFFVEVVGFRPSAMRPLPNLRFSCIAHGNAGKFWARGQSDGRRFVSFAGVAIGNHTRCVGRIRFAHCTRASRNAPHGCGQWCVRLGALRRGRVQSGLV